MSGLVDAAVLLLTVRGRRTGREITLPVQYAPGTDALWVFVGHAEAKSWWRNIEDARPVQLLLRGETVDAVARLVTRSAPPGSLEEGIAAYRSRFPRSGPAFDGADNDIVLVRVEIPQEVLARARAAALVDGRGITAWVRRHPVGAFFSLTYLLSWGYWIPVAAVGGHWSHFPGLAGPLVAAAVVAALTAGSAGVRDVIARMVRWRVPPSAYVACAVPIVAAIGALAATAAVGGNVPSAAELSHMPGLPQLGWPAVFILVLLINGYGEETGWRGFAWPRLRERHSLAGASFLIAVPWAAWHVPTFWIDSGMRGFPPLLLPGFVAGLAAGAVVLGWLYEHARSSILIVATWHALLNMFSATKGAEGFMAVAVSAVVIAWAIAVLRRDTAANGFTPPTRTRELQPDTARCRPGG